MLYPVKRAFGTCTDSRQTLRHIFHHGTHKFPKLHKRLNITNQASLQVLNEDGGSKVSAPKLRARSQTLRIQRLADRRQENIDYILDTGRMRGQPLVLDASAWTEDDVPGPNVTDKETVLSFARMAADAYVLDNQDGEWQDVGNGFNYTEDFGWKMDGLRGHIFADAENQTVVIAVKGTCRAFGSSTYVHN
jgi:lipase ATG15